MAVYVTEGPWQIGQTFLRPTDSWVETWEQGTADRRLAICLRASVAHDTVAVHSLQSNDQSGLETFSFCFAFLRFRFFFPVLYFSVFVSFLFELIFTFPFPLTKITMPVNTTILQ